MKNIVSTLCIVSIVLTSCIAHRAVKAEVDPSLAGAEVEFQRLMNKALAEKYIDADIITHVEFYSASVNEMQHFKMPKGYMGFQVLPVGGSTTKNAFGGESGYNVIVSKEIGQAIFYFKKGDTLKLRGGTYINKYGALGVNTISVIFKATSIEAE